MYSQNNESHPDKFAGQYPPPPPLREPVTEHPSTTPINDGHTYRFQEQEYQPQVNLPQSQSAVMEQYPPYQNAATEYQPTTGYNNNSYMHATNSYPNVIDAPAVSDTYDSLHNNRASGPLNYSNNNLTNNNSYPSYLNYATTPTNSIQQQQQQQLAIIPQPHSEVYAPLAPPPPVLNDHHSQHSSPTQQYYHNPPVQQQHHQPSFYQGNATSNTAYEDEKDTSSLDSYLRREREEYLKHEKPISNTKPASAVTMTPYEEVPLPPKEEEKRPMVRPQYARPAPPPENEAESYRYRPVELKKHRGCCRTLCCCYNPAITCCSFFWLLVSIAFLAAGVALMIASKVVTDKCNSQCLGTQVAANLEQVQSACGTLCSKVLHDGMFYGGIVVAGLAAIAILWKIIMWTCAGCSK